MLKIFQNSPLQLHLKNTTGKILLRFQKECVHRGAFVEFLE